jgi:hypothetical protein
MAEGEPLSTLDLFMLAMGLYKLKESRPETIASGAEYYLDDAKKSLRETVWNQIISETELKTVRHRDWLLGNILGNLVGGASDYNALSEPVFLSLDVLSKEFRPGVLTNSDVIKQIVETKEGYKRSFLTALSIGLSEQVSAGRRVVVLGAGLRRRTRVWKEEGQALQADVEFFVPFFPLPAGDKPPDPLWPNARSINAGIRISRGSGSAIGKDPDVKDGKIPDLASVRFNFRVPFTAQRASEFGEKVNAYVIRNLKNISATTPAPPNPPPLVFKREPDDLVTTFGDPSIKTEKLAYVKMGEKPAEWKELKDWKGFVEKFCESTDGKELLDAPIGPLLLETINDTSSIKDILKSQRGAIKKDMEAADDELNKAVEMLKKGLIPEAAKKVEQQTSGSQRSLGGLLQTLGLLKGKPGEYSPAKLSEVTVWDVMNRMLDELDGFPLWVKGVEAKDEDAMRVALTLASQTALADKNKQYFGLAGTAYNIYTKAIPSKDKKKETEEATDDPVLVLGDSYFPEDQSVIVEEEGNGGEKKAEKKSGVKVVLHLGKWFEGETLDDNWMRRLLPAAGTENSPWKRRVPIPGLRILPFQRTTSEDKGQAVYTLAARGDLLSFGFDLKGMTKEGLKFLQREKGPLTYFGLGAVEVRFSLLSAAGRFAFGVGVKLKDMRLSFGEREQTEEEKEKEEAEKQAQQKAESNEIIAGLQKILGEHEMPAGDEVAPPEARKPKTRLGDEKVDKFSISVGYLTPLADGAGGTLDVQLYDKKGARGKMIWIPIQRRPLGVYVKDIGIGLKGLENIELGKKLGGGAQITVAVNGGLRWAAFELGFIGAQLAFPLTAGGEVEFSLEGLDVSLKAGAVVVSGSFMKSGLEYGGSLTVELPKFSVAAIGFYGSIPLFDMPHDDEVWFKLRIGEAPEKLLKALAEHDLEPSGPNPVRPGFLKSERLISAFDKKTKTHKTYTVIKDGGKLHVLHPEKTFFFFGMLSAGSGGGIQIGPIELTAVALGFGVNRRLVIPPIEKVAEFPLVKMVMGEGGYQFDDTSGTIAGQLGKAVEPNTLLEDMGESLKAEPGQYFGCLGVRFTISRAVDCFALVVVQFGNEFELSVMGLARFRKPDDPSAKPICYVELQILMTLKPSEGSFKLQALLTNNSWVFNKDCKLTGGFALYAWFDGPYKWQMAFTIGGYHPRFKRPDHFPIVPRVGINWQVSPQLLIKGEAYLALTTSCVMIGARLEAAFHATRVSIWFTAHFDVLVNWRPLYFEIDIGVSLRGEITFALFTLKLAVGVTLKLWGPPVGGLVTLDITVITIPISFGEKPQGPKAVDSWQFFCRTILSPSDADRKATGKENWVTPITQANLVSGRGNPSGLPTAPPKPEAAAARKGGAWKVRADELVLAASAAVPVSALNVGNVKTNSPPAGVQPRDPSGNSLLVSKPVVLETEGLHAETYGKPLGVYPMNKKMKSVLNVTVVQDDGSETLPVDLSKWTVEAEIASLPAALWDAAPLKAPSEPTAALIPDCITGLKRLKPPAGEHGAHVSLSEMTWRRLDSTPVPRTSAEQAAPTLWRSRDAGTNAAGKLKEHKSVAEALTAAGFTLAWQAPAEVRFRELQAVPLFGAVAK